MKTPVASDLFFLANRHSGSSQYYARTLLEPAPHLAPEGTPRRYGYLSLSTRDLRSMANAPLRDKRVKCFEKEERAKIDRKQEAR